MKRSDFLKIAAVSGITGSTAISPPEVPKPKDSFNINDIDGNPLELGHIVAVRYVWNSYVGVVTLTGLSSQGGPRFAFNSPHSLHRNSTYQIISHKEKSHPDYNESVSDWFYNPDESCQDVCPVKIRVYDSDKGLSV